MTLRIALTALSGAVVLVGLSEIALRHFGAWPILAGYAAVVLVALLAERPRYHRSADRAKGSWLFTGERFTDPASGELIEVFERAHTGERDYRRADPRTRSTNHS